MASLQGFQTLRQLIDDFVSELTGAIESQATARARDVVEAALATGGIETRRGRPGRPSAATLLLAAENGAQSITARRPRKKPPIQLCPVPGCQGRAAPIFGMVCSAHKDLPKAKIKQFREARRAAKQGGSAAASAAPSARRGRPRATPAAAKPRKVRRAAARKLKASAKTPKRAAARRPEPRPQAPAKGKVRTKPQMRTKARAKAGPTKAAPTKAASTKPAKPSAPSAAAPKKQPPVLQAPPASGPVPVPAETASV